MSVVIKNYIWLCGSAVLSQLCSTSNTLQPLVVTIKWNISSYLTGATNILFNCWSITVYLQVSDVTKQCKGKWMQVFTHLYSDQLGRHGGSEDAVCLQTHMWMKTVTWEYVYQLSCLARITTHTVDWQLKLIQNVFSFGTVLITLRTSHAQWVIFYYLLSNWFYSLYLFTQHYQINVW